MLHSVKALSVMGIFIFGIKNLQAQETNQREAEDKLHHRVSLVISHAHIPAANEVNGSKHIFIAASIGVNYELWFNSHWAIGLHNDITMQSFNVEKKSDDEVIAREFPVLSTIVAVYKPGKHWNFFAGPGREFEKNESFNVIKTGIEYGIELPKTWEIGFGLDYDIKINGYNTWLIGIGISKNFLKKR